MKRGNELDAAAEIEDVSAQPRDRRLDLEQRLRGERPERDDDLRLDRVDLPEKKGLAGRDFVRLRIAVARRTALDHVRDVDVGAREADGLDDLRQQLAGAPDERLALLVFIGTRRLADEHELGARIADAEDDLLAAKRAELAARA